MKFAITLLVAICSGALGLTIPDLGDLPGQLTNLLQMNFSDLTNQLSVLEQVPCPESVDIVAPNAPDLSNLQDFTLTLTIDPSKCPNADGASATKVTCTLKPFQILRDGIDSGSLQCA